MKCTCSITIILLLFQTPGCAPTPRTDRSAAATAPTPDLLNTQAAECLDTDPARASDLLRAALRSDPYHGPAHNNLGVLYMRAGNLRDAAAEFETARTLMPDNPNPRVNLSIVFDLAGRTDDAIAASTAALEASPDDIAAMEALVRLQIRTARRDARTPRLLAEVALRGETPQWREWARLQLARGD